MLTSRATASADVVAGSALATRAARLIVSADVCTTGGDDVVAAAWRSPPVRLGAVFEGSPPTGPSLAVFPPPEFAVPPGVLSEDPVCPGVDCPDGGAEELPDDAPGGEPGVDCPDGGAEVLPDDAPGGEPGVDAEPPPVAELSSSAPSSELADAGGDAVLEVPLVPADCPPEVVVEDPAFDPEAPATGVPGPFEEGWGGSDDGDRSVASSVSEGSEPVDIAPVLPPGGPGFVWLVALVD